MMNDLSLVPMEFTLKRLVFVNSAKHAYSELLLDKHLAMFGRNNNGKTASLAATKLLLFPETNFKYCYSKFGFEGKDGPYDGEQSFRFYFPTVNSFIALEVQNPTHTFTMVLYRASMSDKNQAFSYHRVFIPVAYSALRHLFWNEETKDFAEEPSIAALIKFTKANGGEIVTDIARLRQLMFARPGSADAQYSIVPLKDNNKDSVTAFSSIYNLAFAMSSKVSDVLPLAIASLIEMQRGRDEEKLNTSLDETYQSFLQLQEKGREIQLKENKKPIFETVAQEFKKLQQNTCTYALKYHQLQDYAHDRLQTLEPEKEQSIKRSRDLNIQFKTLKAEIKNLFDEINAVKTTIKTREDDKKKCNAAIEHAEKTILDYPSNFSDDEIIEAIKVDTQQKRDELLLIQDAAELEKELQTKTVLRDGAKKEVDRLSADIGRLKSQTDDSLLAKQLNEHSTQVLYNLNPSLLKVSQLIGNDDQQIINAFTNLFSFDTQILSFKGIQTDIRYKPYTPEQAIQQLESELHQQKNAYQDYKNEVDKLHELIRNLGDKELSKQNENQLSDAICKNEADVKAIQALPTHRENLEFALNAIEKNQRKLELSQDNLKTKDRAKEQLQGQIESEGSIFDNLSEQVEKYDEVISQSNIANGFYMPQDKKDFSAEELTLDAITADAATSQAKELVRIAKDVQAAHVKFHQNFTNFARDIQIEHVDPDRESYSLNEFAADVLNYQQMFDHLAFEKRQFSNAVLSHNEAIRAQLDEIKESRKQLNRTVSMLNHKLNHYRVSNLSEIRLNLETIEEFDALDHALENYTFSSDTLPEEDFYKSLMEFFNKHQIKGRLKMADLIKSINYRYKIDDVEVTKSQSGGTTTTITSFVLSVLLNEIKVADSLVRMPIIVDEISALDAENAASTIKQIGEYGFSIFCATPEFTGYLVNEVGRYIYINQNRAKSYMDPECQWNIMPYHMNYWGEHEIQS